MNTRTNALPYINVTNKALTWVYFFSASGVAISSAVTVAICENLHLLDDVLVSEMPATTSSLRSALHEVPASELAAGAPSWLCPTANSVVCALHDADDSGTTPSQFLSSPNSCFWQLIFID
jgi:hypothetical protein